MREAGLAVREDAAANIIGRLEPDQVRPDAPCIAFGSHMDAVLHGGRFDGPIGLCCGLEAIRAIRESGLPLASPLELLLFTDEEGYHFAGTFGSRAMFGLLIENEVQRRKSADKPSMAESLARVGKDPDRLKEAVRSPSEFLAFLEVHIEQGPVLESLNTPIGIVEGIARIARYFFHVKGQAGHAGTTPMHMRDDALVKAARIITAVNEAVVNTGPEVVGTIGQVNVHPGAFNIIPGAVDLSFEVRSMHREKMESVEAAVRKVISGIDKAEFEHVLSKGGVPMHPGLRDLLEKSCVERNIPCHKMPSGAGHDAMTFPPLGIPTAMIFIPCKEGKSHCPEEDIRYEDAATAAQVLADTVMRIASETDRFGRTASRS
jgi:hydantoinase/carbamoylase family amidase